MIDRLRRSLLFRLSVGFALTLSVLVGASGLYLYTANVRMIYSQINEEFQGAARLLSHKLDDDRLPIDKELLDVGDDFQVRIMDEAQRVLIETPGMSRRYATVDRPADSANWAWRHGPSSADHSPRSLLVKHRGGWFQLSRDLRHEELLLKHFFRSLMAVLTIAPLAGAGFGHWLVKLGLKPLRYLEHEATNLRPENLGLRIDAMRLPTELAPLSLALNQSIARLETAFARLTVLNGDLAHELRTPVHSLKLEAEHILGSPELPAALEEQVVGMMDTLDHMASLIEQMLFLARSEDPANQVEMAQIRVADLLETVQGPFLSLAEESLIHLEVAAPADLFLRGNALLLRRALHNLVANALRHSPPGGTVRLAAWADAGGLHLSVHDRGEGIPKEFLAKVGQRFLRADASRSRRHGGAGLGLAIVQGIAKLHGAHLRLESTEGAGTVAQITFPII